MNIDKKIVAHTIELYGATLQSIVAMEECSELIQAISKGLRYKSDRDNLAEEIADVYISLEILKQIYEIKEKDIEEWIDYKQARTVKRMKRKKLSTKGCDSRWIPAEEKLPDPGKYILLSFDNLSTPKVGRWEENDYAGAFYLGDEEETCVSKMLFVNAWMELPEQYKEQEE